jgi:hypothetical protein
MTSSLKPLYAGKSGFFYLINIVMLSYTELKPGRVIIVDGQP